MSDNNRMVSEELKTEIIQYEGILDEATISGLVTDLEATLHAVSLTKRKKVVNVFVELIQNQFHYFSSENQPKLALSYIGCFRQNNVFLLESKNLIHRNHQEYLESLVDCVNTLSKEGLIQKYRDQLANQDTSEGDKGAGLGLMDIVRKSGEKLDFKFEPHNEESVYFILKARIE